MQIRKPKAAKPRKVPVKFGAESRGRRGLVKAVMDKGYSKRVAEKAVDTVITMWRKAVMAHDQDIEMPIGRMKVKLTPKHLYKRVVISNQVGVNKLNKHHRWTVYNDKYRIIWRVPTPDWEALLQLLNSKPGDEKPGENPDLCPDRRPA